MCRTPLPEPEEMLPDRCPVCNSTITVDWIPTPGDPGDVTPTGTCDNPNCRFEF